MIETMEAIAVNLEVSCVDAECAAFAWPLYRQLRDGYDRCSVLPMPSSLDEWRDAHRTARKRADHAVRLGYGFRVIQREHYNDEIFEINTSLEERQGRPMSVSYRRPPAHEALPDYPCERHAVRTYGVVTGYGKLVAYLWLYRAGELALISSILGHGDHLKHDVMYLLFQGAVIHEAKHGGFFVYNRHDSGSEGLRYFKSKLGFEAQQVEWQA